MRMNGWKIVSLLALAGLIASGCTGVTIQTEQEQTAPNVATKQPGPPAHAPAHGRRRQEKFRYYPNEEVYFDPDAKHYYWLEAGAWKMGVKLPEGIALNAKDAVTLELDADKPFNTHNTVKLKYPGKSSPKAKINEKGKGKGKKKQKK